MIVPVATRRQGPGRFLVDPPTTRVAILVLGHGAGGGVGDAWTWICWPGSCRRGDHRVRGSSSPGGWPAGRSVRRRLGWTRAGLPRWAGWPEQAWAQRRLFVGGRSAGCPGGLPDGVRAQCRRRRLPGVPAAPARAAGEVSADRAADPDRPRLVVQGTKDSFGTADGDPSGHRRRWPASLLVELPGARPQLTEYAKAAARSHGRPDLRSVATTRSTSSRSVDSSPAQWE